MSAAPLLWQFPDEPGSSWPQMRSGPSGIEVEPSNLNRHGSVSVSHSGQGGFVTFKETLDSLIVTRFQSEHPGDVEATAHMLPTEERQRLVVSLAESLGADAPSIGVIKTPGVVGGSAHLVRSRIPVWTLEGYRRRGLSIDEILKNFPTIQRSDVISAWTYAKLYESEIEEDIRANADESE